MYTNRVFGTAKCVPFIEVSTVYMYIVCAVMYMYNSQWVYMLYIHVHVHVKLYPQK